MTAEQVRAVAAIVTSRRRLDVLVGAAGTGKSTAMAAVRAAWEAQYGRGSVVGLAPSAAAAEVLADAVGVPTENTAKWIAENQRSPERRKALQGYVAKLAYAYPCVATRQLQQRALAEQAVYRRWSLQAGQLVIIDEASMAATTDLDHITAQARQAGAKVLLVGDWAQRPAVRGRRGVQASGRRPRRRRPDPARGAPLHPRLGTRRHAAVAPGQLRRGRHLPGPRPGAVR